MTGQLNPYLNPAKEAEKSKLSAALGLSLLAFTFTSTPSYAITISVTPGATTSSVPGAVLFENFDGTSNPSIGTVTGGTINEPISTNPIPTDPTNHWDVADPPVTVTFTRPASYVGFLVGTADDPNTVTVLNGAQTLAQFSMTSLLPSLTNGFLNITAGSGELITQIIETNHPPDRETIAVLKPTIISRYPPPRFPAPLPVLGCLA